MRTRHLPMICLFVISTLSAWPAKTFSADIMFLMVDEFAPTEGDDAQLAIFEERGDTVDIWDNARLQAESGEALDAADAADLVYIDESIGSSNADPIIDTTTPTLNNEQFAFDNWFMTEAPTEHGSPDTPDLFGGSHLGAEIQIVNDQHPIARRAGVTNGIVMVYEEDAGIDWGFPGEQADIVAIVPGFEDFDPAGTIFVYEQGAELIDGSTAPGMRIGFFISDIDKGGVGKEATLLTESGLALLNATIDYALGLIGGADPGDFDGNGVLDLSDVNALNHEIDAGTNNASLDLDGDAKVSSSDLSIWVKDLKNTWIGDANLDGEFNSSDLVSVFQAGKFEQEVDADWQEGDWNGDRRFNSGDFVVAFQDGGFELGPRTALSAVPEPASAVLFSFGILCLTRMIHKDRRERS